MMDPRLKSDVLAWTAHKIKDTCMRSLPKPGGLKGRLFLRVLADFAITTDKQIEVCRRLDVAPAMLVSRFWRQRLPSVKQHLTMMRLVYVSALFDAGGKPREISDTLGFSMFQVFTRHMKVQTGLTSLQYKRSVNKVQALHRLGLLIRDHRDQWIGFEPFTPRVKT